MDTNSLNLVTRDEVEELVGKTISDNEWQTFIDEIHSDDNLWQTIDVAVSKVASEVII
jgi:hypothetical protein